MRMSHIIDYVQAALEQDSAGCSMEELVGRCPELTWNHVFQAIDYLSRTGQVLLTRNAEGIYRVVSCQPRVSRSPFVPNGTPYRST